MTKRKDECLFCTSRKCYERVVTSNDNGKLYDEIACREHVKELHKNSDKVIDVIKIFASSTGSVRRGDLGILKHMRGLQNE